MPKAQDQYKYHVEELVTRYVLEPTLRDLFVEGESDVAVFNWFAGAYKASYFTIPITLVYVPGELLETRHGGGNRARVIVLSEMLSALLPPDTANVLCVADQDLATVLGNLPTNHLLIFSDFACLESYVFSFGAFRNMFELYFAVQLTELEFECMAIALRDLFLIRAAKAVNSPDVNWIQIEASLRIVDGIVKFDADDFLQRMLTLRGRVNDVIAVKGWLRGVDLTGVDVRQTIHKSDLCDILCWTARQKRVANALCRYDVLRRLLLSQFPAFRLLDFPLFRRVLDWAGSAA